MIDFFEIPKNASRYVNTMRLMLSCDRPLSVVLVRDPYKRFWSAVKTFTDEISLYGSYPPNGTEPRTSYQGMTVDIPNVVQKALARLSESPLQIHLATQSSFIGNKKFDEVLTVDETLSAQMESLVKKYQMSVVSQDAVHYAINVSPHDLDNQALDYIQSTPEVKSKLDVFYAEDLALLTNLGSLKQ